MNTISAREVARMADALTKIDELTLLLGRSHMDVPYAPISAAYSAVCVLRSILFGASLSAIQVEVAAPVVRKTVPTVPARQSETV